MKLSRTIWRRLLLFSPEPEPNGEITPVALTIDEQTRVRWLEM